jgi:hypothetical protein
MREGGLPVPTIRLENYRDGLEDYACVRILEEAIRLKEDKGDSLTEADRRWLAEAKAAIEVPSALVTSLTEFSRNPQELSAWRNKVAGLIEASGLRDIDPWRGKFGLRRDER